MFKRGYHIIYIMWYALDAAPHRYCGSAQIPSLYKKTRFSSSSRFWYS